MDKTRVGLLGMFEVALRLVKQGKIITVHGGSCAFDLSDNDGNRYEVKTATASMKGDKQHGDYRGWVFASGKKNKNIARYEYTAYVLLSEDKETVERVLLIDNVSDRFKNGRTAIMKDTDWQRKVGRKLVTKKWYDNFELN